MKGWFLYLGGNQPFWYASDVLSGDTVVMTSPPPPPEQSNFSTAEPTIKLTTANVPEIVIMLYHHVILYLYCNSKLKLAQTHNSKSNYLTLSNDYVMYVTVIIPRISHIGLYFFI